MFFRSVLSLILLVTSFSIYAGKNINFVSMTDIHFDPFITCYRAETKPCPLVLRLRQAPAAEWVSILAQSEQVPSPYRQDTNYPLLASSLAAAKKTSEAAHSSFVVILGDFLSHHYHEYYVKYSGDKTQAGYQAFVKKTLEFLSLQIKAAFPALDVYMAVGNNDGYFGDYTAEPNGKFYHDIGPLWESVVENKKNKISLQKTFKTGAYYAVDVPGEKSLRIIVLNSVMFSNKISDHNIGKAAEDEFNWLHQQLQFAKAKHKKIFITMHVPMGIDVYATLRVRLFTLIETWKKKYSVRFQAELQEFSPQIAGVLAGHLHSDWFQILTLPRGEVPVSGTPSISPIFGNNPGFKVFYYSKTKQQLENYMTYYYTLSGKQTWNLEYNFNHVYQVNCAHCSLINGMGLLQQTGILADYYKRYYAVETDSQPITKNWPPYWCAIRAITTAAYQDCVK